MHGRASPRQGRLLLSTSTFKGKGRHVDFVHRIRRETLRPGSVAYPYILWDESVLQPLILLSRRMWSFVDITRRLYRLLGYVTHISILADCIQMIWVPGRQLYRYSHRFASRALIIARVVYLDKEI